MRNKVLIYLLVIVMVFAMNFQAFAADEGDRVIDPNKPMIALTFDDGPSRHTTRVLDVLNKYNSKGTFFVLGTEVVKHKELLNEMIRDGHEIGNHTYNHKDLVTISEYELYKQIVGTDDLIEIATGQRTKIMRPPYGSNNEETNRNINKPIILWSLDTLDWQNRNAKVIENKILENVKDGDIILMHDIYESTAQAIENVVPKLVEMGYQLVTVSELNEYKGSELVVGQKYSNMYSK